ncbi:DNA-binding protein [Pedobacter jeongneungensis]|uniref:DNA-binding protein n=1 Tax=Pedobacter jeongneungensis TaxID=947309 RepID=UPI00046A2783|nr:DNA-binding protein [Pedobacter jeongneungensis]
MCGEPITKEDLERFRQQIVQDIAELLAVAHPSTSIADQWLKSAEVKKLLKISFGSLQNLRISGAVKPKKILGVYYYSIKEIEKLFD